jgi:hypothetical protein
MEHAAVTVQQIGLRYLAQTHQMKEKQSQNPRNALRHTFFHKPHQMTYGASGNL